MTHGALGCFFTLAFMLPTMAEAQRPDPNQAVELPIPSVRPVAPPAAQEVPPGSASTSPNRTPDDGGGADGRHREDHAGRTAR